MPSITKSTTLCQEVATEGVNWDLLTGDELNASADGKQATSSIQMGEELNCLRCTGFNFSIPAGSTVTGIAVSYRCRDLVAEDGMYTVDRVPVAGISQDLPAWSLDWDTRSYGGDGMLWGGDAPAVETVNSDGFGVDLYCKAGGAPMAAQVDFCQLTVFYTLPEEPMPIKNRGDLRAQLRTEIRDASEPYAFPDEELNGYYAKAILAYSKISPRDVLTTLELVAGQEWYQLPAGTREFISAALGSTEYKPAGIFGGKVKLIPVPATSGSAHAMLRTLHTIPGSDLESSSYPVEDEPLILLHMRAQCLETLAGEQARFFRWKRGDVEEDPGKAQGQLRAEAQALFAQFTLGVQESEDERVTQSDDRGSRTYGALITKPLPQASKTIYKRYR